MLGPEVKKHVFESRARTVWSSTKEREKQKQIIDNSGREEKGLTTKRNIPRGYLLLALGAESG